MRLLARLWLSLLLLSICVASFAQSPLERAVTLAREKRYVEAQQELQGVSEPVPLNQRIAFHRLKAAIAAGMKDAISAAEEMRKALQGAPDDPSLLLATAVAELDADQLTSAMARYKRSVGRAPSSEESRTTFGFELIRHQAFRPAIEELTEAIATFAKSAPLRTLLGIAQYGSGDVENATATLSAAISVDPEAEPAYRSLSKIVLQSSAAPEARVIEQLCSWNAVVCSALKLRLARQNDDVKLLKDATTELEEAPGNNGIVPCELARAREWANRIPDARVQMEKCIVSDPSPQNHFRLGMIYQRLGLQELARKEMELRSRLLDGMSEQTAKGLSALGAVR